MLCLFVDINCKVNIELSSFKSAFSGKNHIMATYGTILLFFGTVIVTSKGSSIYSTPTVYRDYGIPVEFIQKPCDHPAISLEVAPIAVEEKKPLIVIPEAPKLGEFSLSDIVLPPAPQEPVVHELNLPLLPEINCKTEELNTLTYEEPKHQIFLENIPEGPALPDFTLSSAAFKIEEAAPVVSLAVPQPPELPPFTYEIPAKLEEPVPAAVPCGIFELPSYSSAQAIVQNTLELNSNYAPIPVPEWSAPLEVSHEITIPKAPELPPLALPELPVEQPAYTSDIVIADPECEKELEPVQLAVIPEAPILPPFEVPKLPVSLPEAPVVPPIPTQIIVEQPVSISEPCDSKFAFASEGLPALPELNINTIEEIHEDKKEFVIIPEAPQLPPFSQNIEIELVQPELPKLPELPTFSLPDLAINSEVPAYVPCPETDQIQEVQLKPIPEGPKLPTLSLPAFSAEVEFKESAELYKPTPAPLSPQFYAPAIHIPDAPKLEEINLQEIRLPEVRLPEAPIESSTPCACDDKAAAVPIFIPEYPEWSGEKNGLFFKLPEIDFRSRSQISESEVIVNAAPEYASYYSPKYCVENIVKQRVLPNLIIGPVPKLPSL